MPADTWENDSLQLAVVGPLIAPVEEFTAAPVGRVPLVRAYVTVP